MLHGYRHEALAYSGHDEFVRCCAALAEQGHARNERLIFLIAAAKLADLRDALGDRVDDMAFVPSDEHGRNPARITTLLDSFRAKSGGRRCVGVNEPVDPGRPPAAVQEAHFAESLLNLPGLQSWPMSVVCLYDTNALDDDSLEHMRRTHPALRGQESNPAYDPNLAAQLFAASLGDPPETATRRDVLGSDLADVREFVREFAAQADLPPDRREDFVLAANEVMTNSVRHGGGAFRIALWEDADSIVCEVRDAGHISDPLVGRLAPSSTAPSGRGLWLANHLCDLVRIRSSQDGTVVRLHMER